MEKLEEKIAHLERVVDDLSGIVAAQADDITTLRRRVAALMRREGEREAEGGSHVFGANDRPPPHY
ncbi:SlyX family protein [Rhodobacteraceae bacterium D3-12]|nr:SlyX family protein [Rhodobacteraceae bacterium D3-12]